MHQENYFQNQSFTHHQEFQTSFLQKNVKQPPFQSSQEESLSKEEISDDHVLETKYTMQSLCKSFLKKYADTDDKIEPSLVSVQFSAKLRRVYDLTNILEGGGVIQKVEKGIYKWKGLTFQNQFSFDTLKNDWCSLRNIAFEIKRIFNKVKKGLTCNDLHNILTSGNKNRFNPATIRRKIYECCKVFLISGLLQKVGKYFYNAKMTNKEIILLKKQKIEEQMIEQVQNVFCEKEKNQILVAEQGKEKQQIQEWENNKMENPPKLQQRKAIIRKIVNQIQSQSDLNKFIQDLNQEYRLKKSLVKEKGKIKYQEKSEDLTIESESPRNLPQIQKNIILSSPLKDLYPQFFTPNTRKILHLMPTYSGFSSFQPITDIKSK